MPPRLGALVLAALLGEASAGGDVGSRAARAEFETFKAAYGRVYIDAGEEEQRFRHFSASLERVKAHNSLPGITYWKGLNQFSDMSDEEFQRSILMAPQNCSATHIATKATRPASVPDLPSRIDWRERGVVSEVKNQGSCGSCWTFSTTGCLEAHMALKYEAWQAPRLSEQQLVDCAQAFDNHGCNGGLPSHAFEYIHAAGGLDTEFHYPYTAKDGACKFDARAQEARRHLRFEPSSAGIGAKVPGGSVNLTVGDEEGLKFHLAAHGPVSVAFQVASDFRDYSHGVYTSTVCKNGPGDVNHAVLAVGYGTDPETKMPYWLIKNSWDYSWGDEGFFKIEAFKNMCGVADCMAFPDLYGLNDAPSPQALVV
eukprot:CAMPEP_0176247158 /NCGR_PEP_ID=MMETSP0121_2-20121125/32812_1 /TAXON_ID=160619 /ORGANISM="Kryptoperidinium foliaceum, Strain CCMP 1326" /LENGTH=368 /DNA_ID=CAMNT_0017586807 /DNA_START=53 /DNA_END=1159 /DNA_ORIENTATION=-